MSASSHHTMLVGTEAPYSDSSAMTRIVLTIGLILVVGLAAQAQSVPLISLNPATDCPGGVCFYETHNDHTWGWTFYVNSPIEVTAIAWFDQSGDGLSHSHQVGLWKDLTGTTAPPYVGSSTQQLLGTNGVVIPAGTSATLDGAWRKVLITPITLQPGGYNLGGLDNPLSTDGIRFLRDHSAPFQQPTIPTDSRVVIGSPSISNLSGFRSPDGFIALWGVELGPMLFVTPVPEPASLTLLLVAIGFALLYRSRRRFIAPAAV